MPVMFLPMGIEHVNEVLDIENRSFPTPWSKSAFVQEVTTNDFAHYFVAIEQSKVVGYGGMWLIIDEAHITTLAVHPEFRRQKIAQFLMGNLFHLAYARGARGVTLEVRASNTEAQKLYEKMGFVARGLRKGYYSDTKEDAIIMWKEDFATWPGGEE